MSKTTKIFNEDTQIRLDEKTYKILYSDYLYFKKEVLIP